MLSTDLKTRFLNLYKGDIKDPVLYILLDSIEAYQKDQFDKLILSSYSNWSGQISDGMYEVLKRNLLGYMFPGPIFSVSEASLRDVKNSNPLKLESYYPLNLQDSEGNKNLFCVMKPVWIIPSFNNDITVKTKGENLLLGFNVILNDEIEENVFLSIFSKNADPLILERIRCRITDTNERKSYQSVFSNFYPNSQNFKNELFQSPYESSIIEIPLQQFLKKSTIDENGTYWLELTGLAEYSKSIEKNLTINSFVVWNLIEKEYVCLDSLDGSKFVINNLQLNKYETTISKVVDLSTDNLIEFVNSSYTLDPSYPYQFTAFPHPDKDCMILNLIPNVRGSIKVHYYQYDLSDLTINIPAGRPFSLYEGLDENLKNVQTLVPTSRNELLNDKSKIWDYFREQISSRNRILSKDDIKNFILSYPPFAQLKESIINSEIEFEEKIGRLKGFITPYTEIKIPINIKSVFNNIDKPYFEREIGLYLKSKAVVGNFVKVSLIHKN